MILYTGGTFDILHFGHINFFKKCRNIVGPNGKVVVSLNTDEFVAKYKGKPPLMTFEERKLTIEELDIVDEVIPNTGGEDSKPSILEVKPNIIVIGSDWARKDYYKQMNFTQDWLDEHGIMLCYVPYTKGISTTEIKNRFKSNYS